MHHIYPQNHIISANTPLAFFAKTLLDQILVLPIVGTPTIRIGTTPGGEELMEDTAIDGFQKVNADKYFEVDSLIYVTFTGDTGGTVNLVNRTIINPFNV
jgi:hypothetical protein